jgi:hypothetical protein
MLGATAGDFHVDIRAVVEPDVDRDGYGDLSQDSCPDSILSVIACPVPDTSIGKVKVKKPRPH